MTNQQERIDAYRDGFRNGQADALLDFRSDLVLGEQTNQYCAVYAQGYLHGQRAHLDGPEGTTR